MFSFFGSKKIPQELIRKYEQLGFIQKDINEAWNRCQGDENKIMDVLFSMNQAAHSSPIYKSESLRKSVSFKDDNDMTRAIEISLQEQKGSNTYEPLNPEQRVRPNGLPVGLKNVGNTCYVNSLFQSYFMSQKFVRAVLTYDSEVVLIDDYLTNSMNSAEIRNGGGTKDLRKIRLDASLKLVRNLQKLFGSMIMSHKKYVDPIEVLTSVVDDLGQKIPIGDQRDITEYHLNFLSRIEEAFYYQEKFRRNNIYATKSKHEIVSLSQIQIEDMPASFNTVSTSINPFSSEIIGPVPLEDSFINNHFFGKMKQYITYTQENKKVTESKDLILGPIILDVSSKDLYSGLEKYCTFKVDDYQAPNGEKTKAEGQVWLSRLPDLVFVQLNRVEFDKKRGMPFKLNKQFNFEKEIFLDRFMLDYIDEAVKTNKRVEDLKLELKQKEKALQALTNFYQSNIDVVKVLSMTGDFLKKQMDYDLFAQADSPDDPIVVGKLDSDDKINIASDVLSKYKSHLENNMENLKKNIITIKETIANIFKTSLSKHKYHLVTILVHDGYAGSGHYYSFNRNIQNNSWRRFNDFQVSQEGEETVMTESLGGYANSSAYCLVYLSDKVAQEEINSNKIRQKLGVVEENSIEIERQFYRPLVPEHIAQDVAIDNAKFCMDLEEFRFAEFMRTVVDLYKFRYDMLVKSAKQVTGSSCPSFLNSFGTFLKHDGRFDGLLKTYILDTAIQDTQKLYDQNSEIASFSLRGKDSSADFVQRLGNRILNLPRSYMIDNIMIKSAEENKLDCKLAEYGAEFSIIIYVKFMLFSFLNNKWQDGCYAVKFILDLEANPQSYFVKLVKNTVKVMCLRMSLLAEYYIRNAETEKAVNTLMFLTALTKGVLRPEDIQTLQANEILYNALEATKAAPPSSGSSTIGEMVKQFSHTFHVTDELDKAIMHYSPKDLEKDLTVFSETNLYTWKDINDEAASNQINKLVDGFLKAQDQCVSFHNVLSASKNVMKYEDRKKQGFVLV